MSVELWTRSIDVWHGALVAMGAEASCEIDPPATTDAISAHEENAGRLLPSDLRIALRTFSARVDFSWSLRTGPASPRELQWLNRMGELRFDLESLAWLRVEGEPLGEDIREVGEEGAALIRAAIIFQRTFTGDALAVDARSGAVLLLEYDAGYSRGAILAPSFSEFLTRFTHIGCAGPNLWALKPLLSDTGIDLKCDLAVQWREWAGVSHYLSAI